MKKVISFLFIFITLLALAGCDFNKKEESKEPTKEETILPDITEEIETPSLEPSKEESKEPTKEPSKEESLEPSKEPSIEETTPITKVNTIEEVLKEKDLNKTYILEGVVTAINKMDMNASGAFIFSDETSSIFCYEKHNVLVGQKLKIEVNFKPYQGFPQIANVKILEKLADKVDIEPYLTKPMKLNSLELSQFNSFPKDEIISFLSGHYVMITDCYVKTLGNGYTGLACKEIGSEVANFYDNYEINIDKYKNRIVNVGGFIRGFSDKNNIVDFICNYIEFGYDEDSPYSIDEFVLNCNQGLKYTLQAPVIFQDGKTAVMSNGEKCIYLSLDYDLELLNYEVVVKGTYQIIDGLPYLVNTTLVTQKTKYSQKEIEKFIPEATLVELDTLKDAQMIKNYHGKIISTKGKFLMKDFSNFYLGKENEEIVKLNGLNNQTLNNHDLIVEGIFINHDGKIELNVTKVKIDYSLNQEYKVNYQNIKEVTNKAQDGTLINLEVQIIGTTSKGYLVRDKSGSIFVSLGYFDDSLEKGSIIQLEALIYYQGGKVTLVYPENTRKRYEEVISEFEAVNPNDIPNLVSSFEIGKPLKFEGELSLANNGYSLQISNGLSVSFDSALDLYDYVHNNKPVVVEGYYLSYGSIYNNVRIVLDNVRPKPLENTDIISIIEFNDVHGFIMQNEEGKYGLSNLAYSVNQVRNEVGRDNVLLIGNGDMFQGTALVKMSYGEVLIDAMSAMGFDATCLGNHEFDWDLPMILKYFDGNLDNGEANFPLLNANVYQDNKLITIDGGNIFESIMLNKGGLKVGVIGYIGKVKNSINALYANKYDFDFNFSYSVSTIGKKLKDNGADIIIISIHDSDKEDITRYSFNKLVSTLTYNNEYLIDAVICGHTHTHQEGAIRRPNGVAMPVIQSRPYANNHLNEAGRINLYVNRDTKKVVSYDIDFLDVYEADSNYDLEVEAIIDRYYNKDKETLEEVYCYTNESITRYADTTHKWVTNTILNATGADVAIMNVGGIRTDISEGAIDFNAIYQMNPFDNEIVMHEANAQTVNNFLNDSHYFSGYKDGSYKASGTYTVAVIDYVFYGKYYKDLYTTNYYDTNLVLRDLLIEDLRLRKEINLSVDSSSKLGLLITDYPHKRRAYYNNYQESGYYATL